jgi:predicted enzyme related to lactoylglutathione lyase
MISRLGLRMATELYQVIIVARDMDRMVRFYRDVIGLEVTYPAPDADFSGENWVTLSAGSCTLAIHGGGEIKGSGAAILSFRVDDLDYTYWDLKKRGVEIEEPRKVSDDVRAAHLRDPEGNRVSLEQVGVPVNGRG